MATKVVFPEAADLSYPCLFQLKPGPEGGDPKASCSFLIPKTATKTVAAINAAIKEAADIFRAKNGNASLPANPLSPLHDGDGDKPNGGTYGPECKGHWVLSASSKVLPVVVDAARNKIIDPNEIYAGCKVRASVNFFGYNNRRKGIGCGLLAVQKVADGTPFGTVGSADDFNDGFTVDVDDFLS